MTCVGTTESKAIENLCLWPEQSFNSLLEALECYEKYETRDISEQDSFRSTVQRNEGKLKRGEKLTMTNKMLIDLSKVSPVFFVEELVNIKSKEKSIKTVIAEDKAFKDEEKLETLIEEQTGKKFIDLLNKEPEKYDHEKLRDFVGASIGTKGQNYLGEKLKQYLESKEEENPKIVMKAVDQETLEALIDEKKATILHLNEPKESEQIQKIVDKLIKSEQSCVFLAASVADQLDILCQMRLKNKDESVKVGPVFFDKMTRNETFGDSEIEENVVPGVVKGKWPGALKMYNGNLSNLPSVMTKITLPGSEVVSITESSIDIVPVHNMEMSRSVTYYGTVGQLKKIEEKVKKLNTAVKVNEEPMKTFKHKDSGKKSKSKDPSSEPGGFKSDISSTSNIDDSSRRLGKVPCGFCKGLRVTGHECSSCRVPVCNLCANEFEDDSQMVCPKCKSLSVTMDEEDQSESELDIDDVTSENNNPFKFDPAESVSLLAEEKEFERFKQ